MSAKKLALVDAEIPAAVDVLHALETARRAFDSTIGMLTALAMSMQNDRGSALEGDHELEVEMWAGIEDCLRGARDIVGPAMTRAEGLIRLNLPGPTRKLRGPDENA